MESPPYTNYDGNIPHLSQIIFLRTAVAAFIKNVKSLAKADMKLEEDGSFVMGLCHN